jgi:hypothetical protein
VLANLDGPRFTAASLLRSVADGIPFAASIFFVLAMFRSLVRSPGLGIAAFVVFAYALVLFRAWAWEGHPDWIAVTVLAASVGVVTFVALRFGLLVVVVMQGAQRFLDHSILTIDISAWYGQSSLIAVLLVAAVTIWTFRVSLEGRSLLNPPRRAMTALQWIYANIPTPREIFVTGTSAGGYATPFYASVLARHYPRARVAALSDAAGALRGPGSQEVAG